MWQNDFVVELICELVMSYSMIFGPFELFGVFYFVCMDSFSCFSDIIFFITDTRKQNDGWCTQNLSLFCGFDCIFSFDCCARSNIVLLKLSWMLICFAFLFSSSPFVIYVVALTCLDCQTHFVSERMLFYFGCIFLHSCAIKES